MPRRRSRPHTPARFAKSSYARRLRAEQLEDRRLLATLTVDTPLDSFDNSDGVLSLAEAADIAEDGDTITFAPELAGETITLSSSIRLENSVTIDGDFIGGDGVPDITISGDNRERIFNIQPFLTPSEVVLNGLNLMDGATSGDGGAIRVDGDARLTIANSTISGSSAVGDGGAIYSNGDLSVVNTRLEGNTAGSSGGGIFASGTPSTEIYSSTFRGNSAGDDGGAIFNRGDLTVASSHLSGNSAGRRGGAIYTRSRLADSLYVDFSTQILSSTLTGNSATSAGGAIYGRNHLSVTNSTLVGNSARDSGAIEADRLELTHSTVTGNVAQLEVGGVSHGQSSAFNNSLLVGNSDANGASDISSLGFTTFAGTNLFSAFGLGGSLPEGVIIVSPAEVFAETVTLDLPNALPSGLLADNGGQQPSVALLEDAANPAIDVGFAPVDLDFDVRGFDRGVDSPLTPGILSDAGAFELQTTFPTNPPLVVTTASDTGDDATVVGDLAAETADGLGLSLREAVALANAAPGADQIVFDFGVDGPVTIFLAAGELPITDTLDITGDGKDLLTIDAQQVSRIFHVDQTIATLSGLTLTGGSTEGEGGAVRSYRSSLKITDSVISGSVAARSGGGVANRYGRLEILSSTIRDNRALADNNSFDQTANASNPYSFVSTYFMGGGGVYSSTGETEIRDSLIARNEAVGDNEGVNGFFAGEGEGGGVRARFGGALHVINSTVSGNRAGRAGSGVATSDGSTSGRIELVLESSTVTRNVAPELAVLTHFAVARINNSIVIENTATAQRLPAFVGADLGFGGLGALEDRESITHSLVSFGELFGPRFIAEDGNNAGVPTPGPHLGSLADNGGPTLTHELLPISTVIDAADPLQLAFDLLDQDSDGNRFEPLPFDQRGPGFERVFGDGIDPGAIETRVFVEDAPSLVVTTLDDRVADFSADDRSLREALILAESDLFPGPSEITFADGLTGVITLDLGELLITESLTITGPGHDLLAIDGDYRSRVLHVDRDVSGFDPSIDLTIDGLTIQNGRVETDPMVDSSDVGRTFFSGGGVRFRSTGTLTLNNSAVIGSRAANTINSSIFRVQGGGVFAEGGGASGLGVTVQINGSVISQNQAELPLNPFGAEPLLGGGLSVRNGYLSIHDSSISGNAASSGGGIHLYRASADITRSFIADNNATERGGGIHAISDSAVRLFESAISGNESGEEGGGIHSNDLEVFRSTISGNTAARSGGGIYGGVELHESTVTNNHAGVFSGGIDGFARLINSVVSGNTSQFDLPDVGYVSYARHSLIGVAEQPTVSGVGNLVGTPEAPLDALLGPLADNGGPTQTHALLPGSPALNAGDPNFNPNATDPPALLDQRGQPFGRVVGGRIDIGAYEAQGVVTRAPGDYNGDNRVDVADYAVWRNAFGSTAPITPLTGADGDGDGLITEADYDVWRSHFGFVFTPPSPSAATAPAEPTPDPIETLDTAFALLDAPGVFEAPQQLRPVDSLGSTATPDDSLLLLALDQPIESVAQVPDEEFEGASPEESDRDPRSVDANPIRLPTPLF